MTLSAMVMKIVLGLLISDGLAGRLAVRMARESEMHTGTVTESILKHSYINCIGQPVQWIVFLSHSFATHL